MRRRSNLMVLLGIAFFVVGGAVAFLVTRGGGDTPAAATEEGVSVVIAAEDLSPGSLGSDLVAEGKVREVQVAPGAVAPGAVRSLAQLDGATVVEPLGKDQQVVTAAIHSQGRTFEIPDGHEAVAVQVDFVAGGAGYVRAGDRINLYGVFAEPVGDEPGPSARMLLPAVEVLDVDLDVAARRGTVASTDDPTTVGSARASASSVTYLLAVPPSDIPALVRAAEFDGLYASLLGSDDPGQAD